MAPSEDEFSEAGISLISKARYLINSAEIDGRDVLKRGIMLIECNESIASGRAIEREIARSYFHKDKTR